MRLRLGTRGSALARWQADWVTAQLTARGLQIEQVRITTTGDRDQGAIAELGSRGVFTKEIQRALLEDRIDLAVHSLKDLPTEHPAGLRLAAVPPRGPAGDVLVSPHAALAQLPAAARVGTSSPRRRSQLLHVRRDLALLDIRGNVDTRLAKLDRGEFDALVLAEAGLTRLGLAARIAERLPLTTLLPAPGQGALALETRADDDAAIAAAALLDDRATHAAVCAERTLLAVLEGGCLAPVAAWADLTAAGRLALAGRVVSLDGAVRLDATAEIALDTSALEKAAALGRAVAAELFAQGAAELIRSARPD